MKRVNIQPQNEQKMKSIMKYLLCAALFLCTNLSLSAQDKGMTNTVNDMRDIVTKMLTESVEKKDYIITVDQAIFTDLTFNPDGNMVYLDELDNDLAPTGDEEAGTIRLTPAPFFLVIHGDSVGINLPYTRIEEQTVAKTVKYFMKKSKRGKYTIQFTVPQKRANYLFNIQINTAGKAKIVVAGRNEKQPLTFYGNVSFPAKQPEQKKE